MARPKRNSSRRNSRAKTFKPRQTPVPPPASPGPPPPKITPRPEGLPNSARARAQRSRQRGWNDVFAPIERSHDVLIPTEEQRSERDQDLLENPPRVEIDPMEWWAYEMARQGNDILLFSYQPTRSINPPRPRTLAAGYQESTLTLFIRFRNGQVYRYDRVTRNVWRNFKSAVSPGRFINRVLNFYPYQPVPDLDRPTGMT
ncbi:KTSC domain-containing protein [Nonomuraea typhae]|uniref:KTSC domain-containing protein n=1 Tax=Nonomuraea typhae TaxID=2603600 RepID=A0ABW7YJD5_9ACTN